MPAVALSGRTFVMYHGTTWRNWQRIKQHGFLLSNSASGLGEGVYLTRSERKAEFYRKSKWGVRQNWPAGDPGWTVIAVGVAPTA